MVQLRLDAMEGALNPLDDMGFQVFSFSRRHSNFLEKLLAERRYRKKIKSGAAVYCDWHHHSDERWTLAGHAHLDGWDSVSEAGLLVSTGTISVETAKDALQLYTSWANGYVYTLELGRPSELDISWVDVVDSREDLYGIFTDDEALRQVIADLVGAPLPLGSNLPDKLTKHLGRWVPFEP